MKTIEVIGNETVTCAVLCTDTAKNAKCINDALRMGSSRTIVIGSDLLDAEQKAWHEVAKDVELFPSGTPNPAGNNVLIIHADA